MDKLFHTKNEEEQGNITLAYLHWTKLDLLFSIFITLFSIAVLSLFQMDIFLKVIIQLGSLLVNFNLIKKYRFTQHNQWKLNDFIPESQLLNHEELKAKVSTLVTAQLITMLPLSAFIILCGKDLLLNLADIKISTTASALLLLNMILFYSLINIKNIRAMLVKTKVHKHPLGMGAFWWNFLGYFLWLAVAMNVLLAAQSFLQRDFGISIIDFIASFLRLLTNALGMVTVSFLILVLIWRQLENLKEAVREKNTPMNSLLYTFKNIAFVILPLMIMTLIPFDEINVMDDKKENPAIFSKGR